MIEAGIDGLEHDLQLLLSLLLRRLPDDVTGLVEHDDHPDAIKDYVEADHRGAGVVNLRS